MKKLLLYFDPTVRKMFVEKTGEDGEKKVVLSSPNNFVYAAEIVARVIDIDSMDQVSTRVDPGYSYYKVLDYKPIKLDSGIYYDESITAYKAAEFGFVVLFKDRLRWLSPVSVTRDRMSAYYFIYPTKFGRVPEYRDIEEAMHGMRILARLEEKKIEEQLGNINLSIPKLTRILIGRGRKPVDGHEEYYLPQIEIQKKAGEILSDGRIDFKETGSIIQVEKGQKLLKRVPGVKQEDGYNVYGDKVTADIQPSQGYNRGANIVQSGEDENLFVSSINGCLDVNKRSISVLPIVVVNGDVNYDSGNVDFNGSVHINGSILPGFTVKATGDVIIEKSVEDGCVHAGGDITVKMGVVGKESVEIIAGGNVTAQYLQNAKVEATGEIFIEDSIINSDVFSNQKIMVVSKHGKIIGGKSTALYDIIVNVSGGPNETETLLSVGRNLFIEKELLEVHKEITKWRTSVSEVMRELKVNFGEPVFENPKEFIAKLPSVRKKKCLLLLKELSGTNKELKKFTEKSREIQNKLKLDREPTIVIKEKAYPGTVISIKKSIKKIESPIDNVKYYEDPNDKIIRFTPAV